MKDKLYTLMVTTVVVGGTLLLGWGALIVIGKLFTALVY